MDKSFLDTGYMTGYNYSRYHFFDYIYFKEVTARRWILVIMTLTLIMLIIILI